MRGIRGETDFPLFDLLLTKDVEADEESAGPARLTKALEKSGLDVAVAATEALVECRAETLFLGVMPSSRAVTDALLFC